MLPCCGLFVIIISGCAFTPSVNHRSQRSCGKIINVFTPVSVILFGGGSLCPSMHHRSHNQACHCLGEQASVQGDFCPRRSLSRGGSEKGSPCLGGLCIGVSAQGVSVWEGLCPGGSLSRGSLSGGLCLGVSVQGGLCLGGSLSLGSLCRPSLSRGSLSGGSGRPPRTVTSGRYAPDWNTFLFQVIILQLRTGIGLEEPGCLLLEIPETGHGRMEPISYLSKYSRISLSSQMC